MGQHRDSAMPLYRSRRCRAFRKELFRRRHLLRSTGGCPVHEEVPLKSYSRLYLLPAKIRGQEYEPALENRIGRSRCIIGKLGIPKGIKDLTASLVLLIKLIE